MEISTQFQKRVTPTDGVPLTLRCIRPTDKETLRTFVRNLAPETRYKRFLGHVGDLSPPMLRYLTELDDHDHVAVVALRGNDGAFVGVARMVRFTTRSDRAEAAIVVADAAQRTGLGTLLLETLASAAYERDIRTFVAHALSDNTAIRRVLAKIGEVTSTEPNLLEVALFPRAMSADPSPFGARAPTTRDSFESIERARGADLPGWAHMLLETLFCRRRRGPAVTRSGL